MRGFKYFDQPMPEEQITGIPLNEYIISYNPEEVAALLVTNNYPKPQNIEELIEGANYLTQEKGEIFVKQMLELHPDRDMIIRNARYLGGGDAIGDAMNKVFCKTPTWLKVSVLAVLAYGTYKAFFTSKGTTIQKVIET